MANHRALVANGVFLVDVQIGARVEIGLALLSSPQQVVSLIDRDSEARVQLDLSALQVGTSYRVVLSR